MRPDKYRAVYFLLTNVCNKYCSFCYKKGLRDKLDQLGPTHMTEKTLFDAYDFLFKHVDYDGLQFFFWGGEPLLRFDLIKKAVERYPQFDYHLNSNGVAVNEEVYEFLGQHQGIKFIWSLGSAYENYDGIKEMIKALPWAAKAVKDFKFGVNFTVRNYDTMYDDFCYIFENLTRGITIDITQREDISDENLEKYLSEYKRIHDNYKELKFDACEINSFRAGKKIVEDSTLWLETFGPRSMIQRWDFCGCGIERLLIDTSGKIWPCDGFFTNQEKNLGSIYTGLDRSAIQDHLEILKDVQGKMGKYCEGCEIYGRCTRPKCLATNWLYNKDILKPEKNFCRINKTLYKLIEYGVNKRKEV